MGTITSSVVGLAGAGRFLTGVDGGDFTEMFFTFVITERIWLIHSFISALVSADRNTRP